MSNNNTHPQKVPTETPAALKIWITKDASLHEVLVVHEALTSDTTNSTATVNTSVNVWPGGMSIKVIDRVNDNERTFELDEPLMRALLKTLQDHFG